MARYRILPSHNGAIDYDRAVEADAIEPLADGSSALTRANASAAADDIVAIIPAGYLIFRVPDEAVDAEPGTRDPDDAVAAIKAILGEGKIGHHHYTEICAVALNHIDYSITAPVAPPSPPLEAYDAVAAEEASKEEPEG